MHRFEEHNPKQSRNHGNNFLQENQLCVLRDEGIYFMFLKGIIKLDFLTIVDIAEIVIYEAVTRLQNLRKNLSDWY